MNIVTSKEMIVKMPVGATITYHIGNLSEDRGSNKNLGELASFLLVQSTAYYLLRSKIDSRVKGKPSHIEPSGHGCLQLTQKRMDKKRFIYNVKKIKNI